MDADETLARLRALTVPGAAPDPAVLADLHPDMHPGLPPAVLVEAGHLLADVPPELVRRVPGRRIRVAVTATFTTGSVAPLLRLLLRATGFEPDILVTPYGSPEVYLSDPDSELARFRPDVTLVLLHDEALLPGDWSPTGLDVLRERLSDRLAMLRAAVDGFAGRTTGAVLLHTVPLSDVERRSVVSYRDRAVLGRVWREVNSALLAMSAEPRRSVHVLDLESVLVDHPDTVRDERLHAFAGMAWSASVELRYAREATAFCRAVAGLSRKVLVLDLDNTLWGGVLADDGPDGIQLGGMYPGSAHTRLQRCARSLRRQGVLLAVASKNDPGLVDRVLAEHPDMVLRAGDFVARAVDWAPKDQNLARLADGLGLRLDSFVFADDSRFECELVRHSLPEVAVVHLGGDPASFVPTLLDADHFAVLDVTVTDTRRTDLYRARSDRHRFAASFATARDYLAGLGLTVTVREADEYAVRRLTQLSLRTNQFVLVKGAHTAADTERFARSPDHLLLGFEVADRFGSEGAVGGVWISRHPGHWLIENLVLSCRVFSRGVEHAVLHCVVDRAVAAGVTGLEAGLVRTDRNGPAAEFMTAAGFTPAAPDRLVLALSPPPRLLPGWIALDDEGEVARV
ncbi:HAD-IIIC family phosphatase [Actinophytocola sp.]|uniref:HAD-IIIC family phosphatase n=1 Tax=Actinophytocola sp. TaxID=1872138 RepID=UPI002EDA03C6